MDSAFARLIKAMPIGGDWGEIEAVVCIVCQGIGLIGPGKAKDTMNEALSMEVGRWSLGSLKLLD